MTERSAYKMVFAPETVEHLAAIGEQYQTLIRKNINEQLNYAPDVPTRNRKQLTQPAPFGALWEIRFGDNNRFRVYYRVSERNKTVRILAIGVKERNRLYVGRKEFRL